ncbi:YceI family protein [Halomonas sp. V046]|uniref:YceI family protein n=1 Tax=Halomonas sp. V046 TaxID=3459611 RepID=UPI0040447BE9
MIALTNLASASTSPQALPLALAAGPRFASAVAQLQRLMTPSSTLRLSPPRRAAPRISIAVLGTALLACSSAQAETRSYRIDPDHFSVSFSVAHVGYADVIGLFLDAKGSFEYDEATQALASGRVEIAADSVFTNHEERDDHVRGADFLDAGDHPTLTFVADELSPDGPAQGTLTGQLSLRGETHPVTLAVTLNKADRYPFGHEQHTLGVSATTELKRSDWGMDYAVDNGLVGDSVAVRLEFEAIAQ